MYIFADTAANIPQTIQLSTIQALFGLGVVLVAIGGAWGTLRGSVKSIEGTVGKIEKNLDKLRDSVTEHKADIAGLKSHTKYGVSNSPTSPSDEGKRVLKDSGFDKQYPELKGKIFSILDKKKPRTLYDYEVGACEALEELKSDPLIDPLKDFAVNNPQEPLELIFRIASWVIRDDYAKYKANK